MRIAVLGGSGTLGRALVARAAAAGHEPVSVSRHSPAELPAGASHRVADVTTGQGLAEALAGAEAVVDAANALAGAARGVLVDGTRRVIEAAHAAGARHFVGVSIVGIDDAPLAYYRVKVAQERVVAESRVPWSLVRATQFHGLIGWMARGTLGVVVAPRGAKMQPIDVREAAAGVLEVVAKGPSGRVPDLAGPLVEEMADLMRRWARAAGKRRLVLRPPLPGAVGAFLRDGKLCNPERAVGTITFDAWLRERYP